MIIETLKDGDIDLLAKTAKSIWHESFSYLLSYEQIEYMTDKFLSANTIKENINKGYIYRLLKQDDDIIGFTASLNEEEKTFLSKLYVKEEYHLKGLGKMLIEDVHNLYNKNKMYLTVNKHSRVLPMYKHLGFKEIDAVVSDIGNGYVMDDYIMEKTYD